MRYAFVFAALAMMAAAPAHATDVLDLVDTKIGTDNGGNTHPGALWPFGMVQPGPDTTAKADGDYQSDCSGYSEHHPYLMGFTQTHLSGTGCTDLMDFLLLPFTGPDPDPIKRMTRKMDKASEKGRPGYYTVTLEDGAILCELTASKRVAYHRYTSVKGGTLKVFLDQQAGTYAWWRKDRPPHRVTFAESNYDEKSAVFEGHNRVNCWNDNRDVFAKIAFSRKPDAVRTLPANGRNGARMVLDFKLSAGGSVVAKAAISSVDAEGARANFAADPAGFDFDARLKDCQDAWRAQLGRMTVEDYADDGSSPSGVTDRVKNFYAALYHTMVQPNLFSDVDGRARFADQQWGQPYTGKVRKAEGFDVYTTFSTWDTFRATHPWYTIFNPDVVDGFCKSMMLSYDAIGKLPIWQMFGGENYCMPGVHSIPVIADAMMKGLTDLDPQAVAKAMDVSLVLRCAEEPSYDKQGYWAYETAGASVSRTLECGIDDYATMKVAELAKDGDLYKRYEKRADYYKNLFDPATGCMRARGRAGNFREPFDPYKQKPTAEDIKNNIPNDYTEGGAWQYAFHVLQSPFGLMQLHGGPDRFGDALEKLFTDNTEVSADKATDECSGRIGQFALGNEHDQHVPYLFQAAGRPHRTEEIVRELCDKYFRPTPDGICGNDDCGQISAWYLFACMGFYPVNPVGGDYFLGAPQLKKVEIKVERRGGGGQRTAASFTVIAKGISKKNKYVKSVTLNGKPYDSMILKHKDIMAGGELVFEMTDVPKHASASDVRLDGEWEFAGFKSGCGPERVEDVASNAWKTVRVPHDWAIAGPFNLKGNTSCGGLPYNADGWYRRSFELSDADVKTLASGGRAYLHFGGVMARPQVFVNGHPVGGWNYGYMSFTVDVSLYAKAGKNALAVFATTKNHGSRWYPGGGLYRSVTLKVRPADHILPESVAITTPAVTPASATVRVTYAMSLSGTKTKTFEVKDPHLWSMADPHLYELTLEGETFRYGIRTFGFDPDGGFFLNGERVQLKGVNLHSDLGIVGMAFDRDVMRRQLAIMRDMGVNAIRTSHNAPAEELLDLCDEMGFFVWDECFDRWDWFAGRRGDENLEQFCMQNLRQFVRRDRNHPSVFVWSIGNEIPPADAKYPQGVTRERCRVFRETVLSEDRTRPVGIGECFTEMIDMQMLDDLDITGWNYARKYAKMKAKYPRKPVLYSESASALSSCGFYSNPPSGMRTGWNVPEREVDSYDHNAATWSDIADVEFYRMEKDRFCGGEFVWTGIDYLGEPTPFMGWFTAMKDIPAEELARSSYFGIVDLTGLPKDRFYLYRSHWNPDATTLHLLPHWNWQDRAKGGRLEVPVYLYTNGDEAELFLNGRSLGRKRKQPADGYPLDLEYPEGDAVQKVPTAGGDFRTNGYYRICDRYRLRWTDVPYEPGVLKAVAYRGGKRIGETEMRTAGEAVRVTLKADPYNVAGSDLVFVQVGLADRDGVRDPLATNRVSFTAEGCEIVSVGNGNPRGTDSFKATASHPLYYGNAMVLVRLTKGRDARLVAEVPGLESATMEWKASAGLEGLLARYADAAAKRTARPGRRPGT